MIVTIVHPQLSQHFPQRRSIVVDPHRLMIGPQYRVLLAPHLIPVDSSLGLIADTFNHLLGLLLIKVILNQLIQRHMIEHGQPFGLPDVRQGLIGLPFGNGLTADSQLFGYIFLRKPALFPGMIQTASQTHGVFLLLLQFLRLSIPFKRQKIYQETLALSPGFPTFSSAMCYTGEKEAGRNLHDH